MLVRLQLVHDGNDLKIHHSRNVYHPDACLLMWWLPMERTTSALHQKPKIDLYFVDIYDGEAETVNRIRDLERPRLHLPLLVAYSIAARRTNRPKQHKFAPR